MSSLLQPGIFTAQGFLAVIFLAFSAFLAYKQFTEKINDRKHTYMLVGSLSIGFICLVIYISQIKDVIITR